MGFIKYNSETSYRYVEIDVIKFFLNRQQVKEIQQTYKTNTKYQENSQIRSVGRKILVKTK